jgi:hypothetical protein
VYIGRIMSGQNSRCVWGLSCVRKIDQSLSVGNCTVFSADSILGGSSQAPTANRPSLLFVRQGTWTKSRLPFFGLTIPENHAKVMGCTPVRCTPGEMHARKSYAHAIHAQEMHAHEMHAHESRAHESHT